MVIGLWNYAIKAHDIERTTAFYVEHMGAELRLKGEVFGCKYHFLRLGDTRLLIFDRAPYEEQHGMNLAPGFLHVVYEVDDRRRHTEAGVVEIYESRFDIECGARLRPGAVFG